MLPSFFLSLIINIYQIDGQLLFTSLTMPHKDIPAFSSSSSNHQNSPSMRNYYHHPYYHLAFNDSDSVPDEQRLMAQLLRNYDPSARPVYNASNTVSVAFGIALTQLSDMVRLFSSNKINDSDKSTNLLHLISTKKHIYCSDLLLLIESMRNQRRNLFWMHKLIDSRSSND
ncbi:Acetylcholine receptor subunit beta-like 1 [Dictyocoela muelleri]|nr:Acetylcholine receptor subunit beta-like 1 [Dictyocoela muelleri]